MGKTLLGIILALSGLLVLVGLTFSRAVEGPADFRFVNVSEPKTLDPQMMTGEPEHRIADTIFEGLTRREARTLRPVPGVAESWDVSPDGLTYTFHIRQNARWTDGHPVTADDFVYSWIRALAPDSTSEYGYILFPIRHAEAFSTYEGHAKALDGPVARALSEFASAHGNGADAGDWQRFLTKAKVFDPLKTETHRAVTELLARRKGTVTAAEITAFAAQCKEVAEGLHREAKFATEHFGLDQGLFSRGPKTLVVELRAPTPYFLELTAFHTAMPAPRWVVEKHPNDWFLLPHLVSNGPFFVKRWIVNDHIRFEKSETYWGKDEVKLKSVDAVAIESDTTALNLQLTGAVDWNGDWYPKDLSGELRQLPESSHSKYYQGPGLVVYYYRLNTTRKPFTDRRVREALNLALDRKLICEKVLGEGQPPATTFVPPGIPGYEPPETGIRFDVERARALLAEAGFPEGKGFPKTGLLYNTSSQHKKIAETVADQLRRNLGIEVNAYNQEWQSFLDSSRNLDYEISRAAWVGDYGDPNTFLDMWTTNSGNNQTGFSSALYDRLIAAAADVNAFLESPDAILAELDDAASLEPFMKAVRGAGSPEARLEELSHLRFQLLRKAEHILVAKEFPIMPVYFYVHSGLLAKNVRGFYTELESPDDPKVKLPNLMDLHPFRDVWIEPGTERSR